MLTFDLLDDIYAICRMAPDDEIPAWAQGPFQSITRTTDELSIICLASQVPENVQQESKWRCLKIVGPLDLGLIGILAEITHTLAKAEVNVLAIGTFDTDYILVKQDRLATAQAALVRSGHTFLME